MISELERLVETITREKNIPRDVVIEILESAMEAAARKRYGMTKDIEAQYNDELGEVELFEFRTVVDDVEDEDIEITLEEAQQLDHECLVGDSLGIKMKIEELGRIAAQTAKQVIIQKIRDAERELTFNEFKDRKGELITGIVRRFVWRVKSGDRSKIVDHTRGDFSKIAAADVLQGARAGDGVCVAVVRDTAKYIGMAVANLATLFDPEVIVLGGMIASSGDIMLETIKSEAARRLMPQQCEQIRIVMSTLGDDAVAIGAALASAQE